MSERFGPRRVERRQLEQFEEQTVQRPAGRLLLWTGEPQMLSLTAPQFSVYFDSDGEFACVDLGKHYWIVRHEFDFTEAPFDYVVSYAADPGGRHTGEVLIFQPDAFWTPLFRGRAEQVLRFANKRGIGKDENGAGSWHAHCPVFARYFKVHAVDGVSANPENQWRIYADTAIDMTSRLKSGVTVERTADDRKLNRFVVPEMSFTLADSDDALRLRSAAGSAADRAGLRDSDGVNRVRLRSRWTWETAYQGEDWAKPLGFEESGYWPVFAGSLTRRARPRRRSAGQQRMTEVAVTLRSGAALRSLTTQPLHEQITPLEYLRDHVTVHDKEYTRIMDVSGGGLPVQTVFEEPLGRTRVFGEHWWEAVVQIDATIEKVHGIATDGLSLYALTFQAAISEETGDDSVWWIVRMDFSGQEIERRVLAERYGRSGSPSRPIERENWLCDLTIWNERLLVTCNYALPQNAWGHGRILSFPLDFSLIGDTDASGVAAGASVIALAGSSPELCGGITALPDGVGFAVAVDALEGSVRNWHILFYDGSGSYAGMLPAGGGFAMGSGSRGTRNNRRGRGGTPEPVAAGMARRLAAIAQGNGFLLLLNGDAGPAMDVAADASRANVEAIAVTSLSFGPFAVAWNAAQTVTSNWPYSGLLAQGDFVLAAGYGPSGQQEIAKVAQLGYHTENGRCVVSGGAVGPVNFPVVRLKLGADVLTADQFLFEAATGHVQLLVVPKDNLDVQISYDFEPSFGFVKVAKKKRWETVLDCAAGFGLVARIDEWDRLCFEPRIWEERMWANAGRVWKLGQSADKEGVGWIVPETVRVLERNGRTSVPASDYTLSSEKITVQNEAVELWRVTAAGGVTAREWVIKFAVQQTVRNLGDIESDEEDVNDERLITVARVTTTRRVPADFPQRIAKEFAVGPYDAEIDSSFERLQPVEAGKPYDWKNRERQFVPADAETSRMHVAFNEPLLLGRSLFAVRYGVNPLWNATQTTTSFWLAARFRKISFASSTHPPDEFYHVWISQSNAFRLATRDDFEDMIGNCLGADPANADDIQTTDHFYVKKMNESFVAGSAVYLLAYHSREQYYRRNASGNLVQATGKEAESYVKSSYGDRSVRIDLEPRSPAGVPLFFHDVQIGGVSIADARLAVRDVVLTSEGIRLELESFGTVENRLLVAVTGYPVLAAEQIGGVARADDLVLKYGEQERALTLEMCPNERMCASLAAQIIDRRADEPAQYEATRPLMNLLREDELVWVTDEDDAPRLMRTVRVTHREAVEGSVTEVVVE